MVFVCKGVKHAAFHTISLGLGAAVSSGSLRLADMLKAVNPDDAPWLNFRDCTCAFAIGLACASGVVFAIE